MPEQNVNSFFCDDRLLESFYFSIFPFLLSVYRQPSKKGTRSVSGRVPSGIVSIKKLDYFRVTFAPCSSIFFFISSASALEACSFTTFGAPSTRSFASFRPRPVISRITLMTLILFGPTSVSSTSNSVFSSAGAAPAAGPATTTPAAADTPNSSSQAFTRSFSSVTLSYLIASINSAVVSFAIFSSSCK